MSSPAESSVQNLLPVQAYFDTDGNLVLETYNSKTDTVTYKTYVIVKQ